MKELVVISGKGGTGKTSLVASFAASGKGMVLADCDVDAADLHLVLSPSIRRRYEFKSGHEAVIRQDDCTGCDACFSHCRFDAVEKTGNAGGNATYEIDPVSCEGCGVCVHFCPESAINFPESTCGEWFVSDTRCGPMVHARLGIAAENSGKLVSTVRGEARRIAQENDKKMILVDGPPGIGCPVIASITGASFVLVITEPTLSGRHDLLRILELTKHFNIQTGVCINKWDLNKALTEEIEREAESAGCWIAGRIRYDNSITAAQIDGKAVVEFTGDPITDDIERVWEEICKKIR